jgi:hypothetical protein
MSFDPRSHYQNTGAAERYDDVRFRSMSGRVFQWADRKSLLAVIADLNPGLIVLDAPCGTGPLS